MGRRGDASDQNTAEGTYKKCGSRVGKSECSEVFPGHTVPSDTLWLCTSCQTRKPWNDFHHANRIGMSQLMCKVCFFNHIPDVSL